MSDTPSSPSPTPVAKVNPVKLLSAISGDARWPVVKLLADGRSMSIRDIAAALRRQPDITGRHLQVLVDAGVIEAASGEDRRYTVYRIARAVSRGPGVLDFGFCVLDLNKLV